MFNEIRVGDEDMHLVRSKKGLSVVVTTLIILVVSVLLATIVTLYAINVTTTRVQEEAVYLTKQHVWYNTTSSWAQAAMVILNTGGRDIVIDKISVRGQECNWNKIYY
jgi:peptidoglycan biosynthesis protein MviN/MurJ (putative lipid II flippase)